MQAAKSDANEYPILYTLGGAVALDPRQAFTRCFAVVDWLDLKKILEAMLITPADMDLPGHAGEDLGFGIERHLSLGEIGQCHTLILNAKAVYDPGPWQSAAVGLPAA